MIESIEISNLRGIREGKLTGLTPLTVLVGPNGCGKSTVLDALLLGCSPWPGNALQEVVRRRAGVKEGARWLWWRARQTQAFVVSTRTELGTSRVFRFSHGDAEHSEATRINFVGHGRDRSVQTKGHATIRAGGGGTIQHEGKVEAVTAAVRFAESPPWETVPLHTFYSSVVERGRRRSAVELVTQLLPGVEDVEILTEADGTPILHFVYPDYSVPVALAGDGIHALLRLVFELASCPQGLVLLEEPEAHQHPGAIRQSIRAILAAVRRDVQVVLTTHSLELIDIILAEATEEDLGRLSVVKLKLKDGELISHRLLGKEVAFARQTIEDDLR